MKISESSKGRMRVEPRWYEERAIMKRSGLKERERGRGRCWRRDNCTKDVSKGHKEAYYVMGLLKYYN